MPSAGIDPGPGRPADPPAELAGAAGRVSAGGRVEAAVTQRRGLQAWLAGGSSHAARALPTGLHLTRRVTGTGI